MVFLPAYRGVEHRHPARNTQVNADTPLPEPGSTERPRLAYWTAGMLDWVKALSIA